MSQNNEVLAKRQATDYGPKKKPKVELRKIHTLGYCARLKQEDTLDNTRNRSTDYL